MVESRRRGGEEVESPDQAIDVPDPRPRSYEPSHVIQILVELQRQVAGLSEKTDRLDRDVDKVCTKVDGVQTTLARAQGFGIAAVLLIPICAGIVWWLIGGKINDMRDQLINSHSSPTVIQQTAPNTAKPK
jgi:hypothetical protein